MKHISKYKILPSRWPRIVQRVVRFSDMFHAKGVIILGWLFVGIERVYIGESCETYVCWAHGLREIVRQPNKSL